jgi:hypothetical protein
MRRVEGKRALIAGGTSGIGFETAGFWKKALGSQSPDTAPPADTATSADSINSPLNGAGAPAASGKEAARVSGKS